MIKFILDYWNGEKELWKAYWIMGILIGGLCLGSFGWPIIFFLSLYLHNYFPLIIYGLFYFIYFGWNWISIWRCSKNVEWNGWFYVSRIMVIYSVLFVLAMILGFIDFNIGSLFLEQSF